MAWWRRAIDKLAVPFVERQAYGWVLWAAWDPWYAADGADPREDDVIHRPFD